MPGRGREVCMLCLQGALALWCASVAVAEPTPALTMADAVSLAFARNREVIAAKLQVADTQVEQSVARLWDNPQFSFAVQNLVFGRGNDQNMGVRATFGDQRQEAFALQQTIDVWGKRRKRLATAKQATLGAALAVEDVLRELAFRVRGAFVSVVRAQAETKLVAETLAGYGQTVELMRRREAAGDIARSDLDKIELEAMRYEQDALQASLAMAEARAGLAELLGVGDGANLPAELAVPQFAAAETLAPGTEALVQSALASRPDIRQAEALRLAARLRHDEARRDAYPDVQLGVAFNRSYFVIGGDNPYTLQLTAAIDVPVFNRNQGGRAHAALGERTSDNDLALLKLAVEQQVRKSAMAWQRAGEALRLYEQGGMLSRAQRARDVAKRSFAAGATSLLELLEAERTSLATQATYLTTLDAWRQAHIEVAHATGQAGVTLGG